MRVLIFRPSFLAKKWILLICNLTNLRLFELFIDSSLVFSLSGVVVILDAIVRPIFKFNQIRKFWSQIFEFTCLAATWRCLPTCCPLSCEPGKWQTPRGEWSGSSWCLGPSGCAIYTQSEMFNLISKCYLSLHCFPVLPWILKSILSWWDMSVHFL